MKSISYPKKSTTLKGLIYGSKIIVNLLADFERQGAKLSSGKSNATFLKLCAQMRSEGIGSETPISTDNLEMILFGPER